MTMSFPTVLCRHTVTIVSKDNHNNHHSMRRFKFVEYLNMCKLYIYIYFNDEKFKKIDERNSYSCFVYNNVKH